MENAELNVGLATAEAAHSPQYGDFPAIFRHADASAISFQRRHVRLMAMLIVVSVISLTVSLMVDGTSLSAIAGFAFLVATVVQFFAAIANVLVNWSRRWYESRALAESARSMTWKYAVGGSPFGIAQSESDAKMQFSESLLELARSFGESAAAFDPEAIDLIEDTSKIDAIRALPLEQRQAVYRSGRLTDQLTWYVGKARFLGHRAKQLNAAIAGLSLVSLLLAVASVASNGELKTGFASIFAAGALGMIAYSQMRKYSLDVAAYQLASYELRLILCQTVPETEDDWSAWVDDAEEAMSREHVMWQASRSVRTQIKKP